MGQLCAIEIEIGAERKTALALSMVWSRFCRQTNLFQIHCKIGFAGKLPSRMLEDLVEELRRNREGHAALFAKGEASLRRDTDDFSRRLALVKSLFR